MRRRDFLRTSAIAGLGLFVPRLGRAASNRIVEENARPGTDRWMLYSTSHEREIEGYASATSVNVGETIRFHVHTPEPSFQLQIFRLGWYGGLGGRAVTAEITLPGLSQAMPPPDPETGLVECNWQPSYTFAVPQEWVSGGYLAKLSTSVSRKESWIPFIVREDDRRSDLLFQSSVTTNHAYNNWGGKSLYAFNSTNGATGGEGVVQPPLHPGSGAAISSCAGSTT